MILLAISALALAPLNAGSSEYAWYRFLLPPYGIGVMLCGVLGLIALLRRSERSWLVWLTLLPGTFVLYFLLGELLFPH